MKDNIESQVGAGRRTGLSVLYHLERHANGPRVHVLGRRIHEYQLGLGLLVVAAVTDMDLNRWVVIVGIIVVYFVISMFMDEIPLLLLTLQVTFPLIVSLGFDPVWFGVMSMMMMAMGLVFPPVGIVAFVVSATGQVPPAIAEWLDLPQVTYANRLKLVDGSLRARRQLHAGFEEVEAHLPCVVSLVQDINEPRFLDFARFEWAMDDAPVTIWSAQDLRLDPSQVGLEGSPTTVAGVSLARGAERRREFISGTPEEITDKLLEKIRPWVRSA